MKTINIHARAPYSAYIGRDFLTGAHLSEFCRSLNAVLVIVTDEHVKKYWGDALEKHLRRHGFAVSLLSFPAGECYKTRETKMQLEDQLFERQCGRDTCLIALGGGVVLDMVGFLGATYARGIPVMYIPTTLLAMVDACIGGKTGVNTPFGKNLVGTISAPHSVHMDVCTLSTLSPREWKNGVVEMIKHTLLRDAPQFEQLHQFKCEINDTLEASVFENSIIKKTIVEEDETEQNARHLLNFGHTIGHAIEKLTSFSVSHGEAVAIGLLVEGYLSMRLQLLQKTELERIEFLLRQFELPLKTSAFQDCERILETLVLDKKSSRKKPRFVLLNKIGQPLQNGAGYLHEVDEKLLIEALHWANVRFGT